MFKNLWPGAIGIREISLPESIQLAKQTGFAGIDFNIREAAALADEHSVAYVSDLFKEAEIEPALWSLPVAWSRDQWQDDLKELPRFAALGRELGSLRTTTACSPSSDQRPFDENYAWHIERLRPIAEVLRDHGIRFGLEFLGPQHMRPPERHTFIYTLEGMLALLESIGTDNLGLMLDIFHLCASGGSVDDLDDLSADDIVTVHVNDVARGLSLAEYQDLDRGLPMEKGGLPLREFMQKLVKIGYEGPITCEPFSKRVNAIEDPLEAAQLTASYMDQLWQASGLGSED
ncbi:sugar phosphate isomerase/epimerase [Chloroflexi bacterium TSY]|nr:sugar phosphate isomerase/epimerase [Chloroflexi bacterium TSY]